MHSKHKVSIIIPTYDRAKDLDELLNSILQQTILPLEVIVVDDEIPTGEVRALCERRAEEFAQRGIRLLYLRNHRKRSAAVARNIGAEVAQGDILLFLDSDIILFPNFIAEILKVFNEKPEALGVSGYIVNVAEDVRRKRALNLKNLFNRVFHSYYVYTVDSCRLFEYPMKLTKVISCEWLNSACTAYRREVFSKFKFDESLEGYSYMEDVLLSHSIYKAHPGSLYITPYAGCIHKNSPKLESETELRKHKDRCRKYVLRKLFGLKGILLYYWQNAGLAIIMCIKIFKRLLQTSTHGRQLNHK